MTEDEALCAECGQPESVHPLPLGNATKIHYFTPPVGSVAERRLKKAPEPEPTPPPDPDKQP